MNEVISSIKKNIYWDNLKNESLKTKDNWNSKNEWWNTKFYKNNPPNDGSKTQITLHGESEIPWDRNPFSTKNARFSLKEKPTAYFSSDFTIICCETIELLRRNFFSSWQEHLKPYLSGITNPSPNSYGYPLDYALLDDATILDLRVNSHVSDLFCKYFSTDLKKIITSTEEKVYPDTQKLSEMIYKNGFDGIVYNSVRLSPDNPFFGCNLVLFNNKVIVRWYDYFMKN